MTKTLLGVIVPVGPLNGEITNLSRWLTTIENSDIQVVISLDIGDELTRIGVKRLVEELNFKNIKLIEVAFGNPGEVRNAAFAYIDSRWITFWDADDLPHVEKYILSIQLAEDFEKNVIIGNYQENYSSNKSSVSKKSVFHNGKISNVAANPGLWRWIFRKEIVDKFKFSKHMLGEDQCFLLDILNQETKIFYSDSIFYEYSVGAELQLTSRIRNEKYLFSAVQQINKKKLCNQIAREFASIARTRLNITYVKMISLSDFRTNNIFRILRLFRIMKVGDFLNLFKILSIRKAIQSNNPLRYLLIGGLGNQLFQISAGLYFAEGREIEFLIEDKSRAKRQERYKDLQKYNFPTNVKISQNENLNRLIRRFLHLGIRFSGSISSSRNSLKMNHFILFFTEKVLKFLSLGKTDIVFASGVGLPTNIKKLQKTKLTCGYFQTHSFASHKYVNKMLMNLSAGIPPVRELEDLFNRALSTNVTVVHMRFGDYLSDKLFSNIGNQYFENCISHLERIEIVGEIWLFSDDISRAVKMVPQQLLNKTKIFEFYPLDPILTLESMKFARNYVLSNSTFGWWAAFLAHTDPKRVYVPDTWFIDNSLPYEIYPANWYVMNAN